MSLQTIARVFAGFLVLFSHGSAHAADEAAGFISDLGNRTIDILTSSRNQQERESRFHKLLDEAFDVPRIARFVLGPYWRTATDAQRDEFPKLFETYIVHVYVVRFSGYSGEQLKVTGSRPEGENTTLVTSEIIRDSKSPPVKVDWRVAKSSGGFKIIDVVVEGVSMAVLEREEFSSVIRRGGGQVDVLLKELRERSGQG